MFCLDDKKKTERKLVDNKLIFELFSLNESEKKMKIKKIMYVLNDMDIPI